MFYKFREVWVKIAIAAMIISFILAMIALGWFCHLVVSDNTTESPQSTQIERLIESNEELIDQIDQLINTVNDLLQQGK